MPPIGTVWTFSDIGQEQTFIVPYDGKYKLEVWGSSGYGYNQDKYSGGYGGYSIGNILLTKNTNIYVNVGTFGEKTCTLQYCNGGYNGGGRAAGSSHPVYSGPGGGATHMALKSGLLKSLINNKEEILIVAGGGGGASYQKATDIIYSGSGGSGGGYIGNNGSNTQSGFSFGHGGSQVLGGTSGGGTVNETVRGNNGSFGQGGDGNYYSAGGGGGWYGGGASNQSGAGGGSGYIGNNQLIDKVMYCYNCTTSNEESTKTISTSCINTEPISNCAKSSGGYARITLISY